MCTCMSIKFSFVFLWRRGGGVAEWLRALNLKVQIVFSTAI